MAEKRVSVMCPKCRVIVELEKGLWGGWKKQKCPKCDTEIRMRDNENQVVECPSCRKEVAYHILRKNDCPSCGKPLFAPAESQPKVEIHCPFCQSNVLYSKGKRSVVCSVCHGEFDPDAESARIDAIVHNDAPDIRMTGTLAPDELVWKHPRDQFPLNARIIAEAGMVAVCMQGGEVKCVVQGRSVLLSETDLKADAYAYGDGAEKHVYANIYYVRERFRAAFVWGGEATMVGSSNECSTFGLNGRCELDRITDYGSFLRWIQCRTDVHASDFSLIRDERGVETLGAFAMDVRNAINGLCGESLRNTCDRSNLTPAALVSCKENVAEELKKLANYELRKWGVSIRNVVVDHLTQKETVIVVDPLRSRIEGSLEWRAESIPVHLKDMPLADATLAMDGTLRLRVDNDARLKSTTNAANWLQRGSDPRGEIAEHVGELLGSTFAAVFQQLINDINPRLELLAEYAGFFRTQASQIVNAPDGFLAEHGLSGNQLTLRVRVVSKSELYRMSEKVETTITETDLKDKMEEYQAERLLERFRKESLRKVEKDRIETQMTADLADGRSKRADITAEAQIHDLQAEQRVHEAERDMHHRAQMNAMQAQAEEDELRRRLSFSAWQEEERQNAAREAAAMESLRRRRAAEHGLQRDQAAHDRAMHDIMRAVEESDQTWREKLDAYARLQKNLEAQDERDNRSATSRMDADAQVYSARQALNVNTESARVMAQIEREAQLHQEDLDKARFTRDLELRRQTLAEEMTRLRAEYEQENKRTELQQENEQLRMILEYLVKNGDQQVRQATVQAQMASEKAAAERQQDEKHRQEEQEREKTLADRAFTLTQDMMATQKRLAEMEKENQRAYESGRAMVDAMGRRYQEKQIDALVNQMKQLRGEVDKVAKTAAETNINDLKKWLEELMKSSVAAPQAAAYTPGSVQPSYGAQGTNGRTCPHCGKPMAYSALSCPNCYRSC